MNKQEEKILVKMLEELERGSVLYRPSVFWDNLNRAHLECLSKHGFDNFKRTINTKYFNWGGLGILIHQLSPLINKLIKGNFTSLMKSKNFGGRKSNFLEAFIYRVYLVSLYEYVSQNDPLKLLDKIKEPLIGNPFLVKYKDKLISQDLCNSIYDFYSITNSISLPKKARIAELGAGYGRVGYVSINALQGSSYCVIDIPPALLIAQSYLSRVFPKEKIFKFRPFKSFNEVRKEFEKSRIQFLLPHQIELLPNKYFDLFINISSLHEMTREQIKNYIEQINRLCKFYFYTKQWRRSRITDNRFIKENDYPIPRSWRIINRRDRHPIQKMFFDTLYKLDKSKGQNC